MSSTLSHATLRNAFATLRAQGLRARDAAASLGISEGEAMAAHAESPVSPGDAAQSAYCVTPLDKDWAGILQSLETVGPVMALTRNEHVVHEKIGVYRDVRVNGTMGLALGPEIDLRVFLHAWHTGLHVIEHGPQGEQHSLQFFDQRGQAVHKVHARPQTDLTGLALLAQRHARPGHRPVFDATPPTRQVDLPDEIIDTAVLAQAWSAMRDTHEFFELLRHFKVSRSQGMRLMEGLHTRRTPLLAVEWLLHQAAATGLPIMVFAGNHGCLQIHTGAVHRIDTRGPWLNVLDEGFNLHLRHDAIHESWLVTKPTEDGPVTSIELFDSQGELIAMFFGERKPGKPELPGWRELAQSVAHGDPAAARRQKEAA